MQAASSLLAREGIQNGALGLLGKGDDSVAFAAGGVVVRVRSTTPDRERLSGAWRAAIELCVREPSLVVAPLELSDGSLLAELSGFTLSLWPLAPGKRCSGRSEGVRRLGADTLARLHLAAAGLAGPRAVEEGDLLDELPGELRDRELEGWWARRSVTRTLLIHGDFYPGNLLRSRRGISVVDWDEAHVGDSTRELAWAVWEFCHTDGGTRLNSEAAKRFLDTYAQKAGGLPAELPEHLVPIVRRHLAFEMARSLRAVRTGQWAWLDPGYFHAERQAFLNLRG